MTKEGTGERPARVLCQRVGVWLKNNNVSTGALTDTDWLALEAFVHLMRLWASSDRPREVLLAAAVCVRQMQEHTRHVAKRAIPCALDWGHENELWPYIEAKVRTLEQDGA